MGAGVSNWRLAQAVSRLGQLGVVSSTAIDQIFLRRLGDGDPGGAMRRGIDLFPFQEMARRVWREYFVAGGKAADEPYRTTPMHTRADTRKLVELCIVSNFVEVALARMGHDNPVGINLLEKVQAVHLPSLYGAMLAGVGYVLMGAGIPLHIPGVLDLLAAHHPVEYKLSVAGAAADQDTRMHFDPRAYMERELEPLDRPRFLAIVSSNTLATTMLKRANGRVDGFVVETHRAGGHNAPPRGKAQLSETGEPVYGERDRVDLEMLRAMGVPFWMAGNYGSADRLREALDAGAEGVQVGTAFEFADESGLDPELKRKILAQVIAGEAEVFTDPAASPTGFPFKVVQLAGTLSDPAVYEARTRVCDLGFLREPFVGQDGGIGYRCSAEPKAAYVAKKGKIEETAGRKCLCNALLANVGYPQLRGNGKPELPLITAGDGINDITRFLDPGRSSYSAADVIGKLLG
uniref:2-nitropropane dioxygenase, NPD n=1 Tax=mine drainage metagenome TaxID=410659 RepID=E6PXC3_9ZZZZ